MEWPSAAPPVKAGATAVVVVGIAGGGRMPVKVLIKPPVKDDDSPVRAVPPPEVKAPPGPAHVPYLPFEPSQQLSVGAQPPARSGQHVQVRSIQPSPQAFSLEEQVLAVEIEYEVKVKVEVDAARGRVFTKVVRMVLPPEPYLPFEPSQQLSIGAQPPLRSGQHVQVKLIQPSPQAFSFEEQAVVVEIVYEVKVKVGVDAAEGRVFTKVVRMVLPPEPYLPFEPSQQLSVGAQPPPRSGQHVQVKSIQPSPQAFSLEEQVLAIEIEYEVKVKVGVDAAGGRVFTKVVRMVPPPEPYLPFEPSQQFFVGAQPPPRSGQHVQDKLIQTSPQAFWLGEQDVARSKRAGDMSEAVTAEAMIPFEVKIYRDDLIE
ncbi:MAG: hypothetical protein M1813_003130 [Trichoglossum hirsutum]|nr:MAG: hypothetical protein M1813_003130 [Trichoglossum hirsutum]